MSDRERPLTDLTCDAFLGGDLKIHQRRTGYRSGMDAVLLAAGVRATKGSHILEAGSGVGVTALCVARRLADCTVTGLEIDPVSVEIAQRNIEANSLLARVSIIEANIKDPPRPILERSFDHFMCNPPYFDDVEAFRPPPDAKLAGNVGIDARLKDWIDFGLKRLKPRGCITLIHRTERLDDILSLLRNRVGDIRLHPFWPRRGESAKRVLISGTKGALAPPRLLPGIPLHEEGRRYSREAEAILRAGNSLNLD